MKKKIKIKDLSADKKAKGVKGGLGTQPVATNFSLKTEWITSVRRPT